MKETGLEQWKVSDKWKKYDPVKIAEQELAEKINVN